MPISKSATIPITAPRTRLKKTLTYLSYLTLSDGGTPSTKTGKSLFRLINIRCFRGESLFRLRVKEGSGSRVEGLMRSKPGVEGLSRSLRRDLNHCFHNNYN